MQNHSPLTISIILPAINETDSLRETVHQIETANAADIMEYLIVLCPKTTLGCRTQAESLAAENPGRVRLIEQNLPFLGGAIRDAFDSVRGSHAIMMASDLETDPETVSLMAAEALRHPNAIVTATRWKGGARFKGYNPIKLILNKFFQFSMALLYRVKLSDMTYGYRLFPSSVLRMIRWEELKHPFLLETIIKPLRLGIPVIEVPSKWHARSEGVSQNTFLGNFVYFRIALKTLFMHREDILKESL